MMAENPPFGGDLDKLSRGRGAFDGIHSLSPPERQQVLYMCPAWKLRRGCPGRDRRL